MCCFSRVHTSVGMTDIQLHLSLDTLINLKGFIFQEVVQEVLLPSLDV